MGLLGIKLPFKGPRLVLALAGVQRLVSQIQALNKDNVPPLLQVKILDVETFSETFSKGRKRKRPRLSGRACFLTWTKSHPDEYLSEVFGL